jgi:class 3 adenylate cyclase/tetratricopeptide (TPR) repeat protein
MSAAGVETVTILITDLVGSTQLESRVGPIVADGLREEHFGLLREAVSEAGGREVKNTGDGLMVAFPSAAAAVSCAVSIQQRFERRNQSAAEALLIKAGVSSGDASTTVGGDVFGMPVIEAARLCDSCSAGQILAKEIVGHLAAGRGHDFTSVGSLELKGLPEPLDVIEVVWEPALGPGTALPERLRELPDTAYVGRVAERETLANMWRQASDQGMSLALISGEAGVGKTRLSAQLALDAHGEGATVLYGRCDEDLGVPYQPWAQAVNHLVIEARQPMLDAHVDRFGGDLARLAPALRDRVRSLPSPRDSDPETERYLMYAAVAGLLEAAGEREPLLLILDDLHWADPPTLSLLRHVLAAGSSMRALVVGTYRDSDLSRDHPLTAFLADLHRDRGGERIKLTGLDTVDVLSLIEALAGHDLEEDGRALAEEITRESAGNPFFAGELIRHMTEAGAIVHEDGGRWRVVGEVSELGLPQSVREVIGRRVERLGQDGRTALTAAAVIGRDFDLDLLVAVVDLPHGRLLDLLDEAVAASLLQEGSGRAGRFTFVHALVAHTLYEGLGATRRAVLHREVAEALEEQCGDEPGERLGELAGHWAAAVVGGDTTNATDYARRAAERALEQLAPDEAVRWYGKALELGEASADNRSERCELLIGLGEAQRQIGNPESRRTLLDAARLAQELGDTDHLAGAVLANSQGWVTASRFDAVDSERVQALEAAAQALPPDDARRAQVLALLAYELHQGGNEERCRELAAEAIATARAAGDAAALAQTLANASAATWGTDTLQQRREVSDELAELVQSLENPRLVFWAALRRMVVGLQAGERAQVESSLTRIRAVAASVPEPSIAWTRLKLESIWSLVEGDLQASERWAIEAYEVATSSGEPDAETSFAGHMSRVRYFQGRYAEIVEPALAGAREADGLPSWRAAAALALIESGRTDEARDMALSEDVRSLRRDEFWFIAMLVWAQVCSRLPVRDRAQEVYELLAPFSGQLAAGGTILSGSVDWALGALATALERYEDADRHFAAAAALEANLGAPLLLARTNAAWALALIGRGQPGDLDRAQNLLDQAEEVAERLGARGVAREAMECRTALAAIRG